MHAPEIVDYKNSGVFFFLHYPISWIFLAFFIVGYFEVGSAEFKSYVDLYSTIIFVYNEEEQKSQ